LKCCFFNGAFAILKMHFPLFKSNICGAIKKKNPALVQFAGFSLI